MKRILQALWFIPLMALALYNNHAVFLLYILVLIITVFGTYELFKIADLRSEYATLITTQVYLTIVYVRYIVLDYNLSVPWFNALKDKFGADSDPTILVLGGLVVLLFLVNLFRKKYNRDIGTAITLAVFASVYTGFFTWYIMRLRLMLGPISDFVYNTYEGEHSMLGQGKYYLTIMLLAIWMMDAGAYYVGSTLGSHKLKDSASPNKSIEGLVGGAIISIIITFGINKLAQIGIFHFLWGNIVSFTDIEIIPIAALLCIISFVGDMGESVIKRAYAKKDSSDIVSGMGGVLDVFDSMILATPLTYYLIYYLTRLGILHSGQVTIP